VEGKGKAGIPVSQFYIVGGCLLNLLNLCILLPFPPTPSLIAGRADHSRVERPPPFLLPFLQPPASF
jgi:hypothetical protein